MQSNTEVAKQIKYFFSLFFFSISCRYGTKWVIKSKEIQRERSLISHTIDVEHKTEKNDGSSLQGVSTEQDEQCHWIHSFLVSNFILPIVFSCFKREREGVFFSMLLFLVSHKLELMWKTTYGLCLACASWSENKRQQEEKSHQHVVRVAVAVMRQFTDLWSCQAERWWHQTVTHRFFLTA